MTPTIRLADESDGERIHAIYTPHIRESATSFELTVPTVEEMAERITATIESHPWLVCEHDGEVVGYAYASPHRARGAYQWSVETSVYVDAEHRRQGVAHGLYESLLTICRLQGFYNAYAGTTPPNPATVELHESLGFESIGVFEEVGHKNGAWHDVEWWERSLDDRPSDPEPPLSIPEARSHERWSDALAAGQSTIRP